MPLSSAFVSGTMEIEKNWIDYNGHLNMAYYNVLFDRGAEEVLDLLGIGSAYAAERRHTIYTSEIHVCYVRELHLGSLVTVSFQLLDSDEKRLHAYQEIRHVDGWLAATSESMSLHVNMEGPRVAAFPEDVAAKVVAFREAHRRLPRPERAGRTIGIRRRGNADINLKKG